MTDDSLARLADHVAAHSTRGESLRNTSSAKILAQQMARMADDLGLAITRKTLMRVIEAVIMVDEPLAWIKPTVDLKLGDLTGPTRLWILILWLAGKIAEPFDTRMFYRPSAMIGLLLRRSAARKPSPQRPMIRDYSPHDCAEMKAMFLRLDDQLWRHHIDWEDQYMGSEVYDRGLHGGRAEPGYIENAVTGHRYAAARLGERLTGDTYEALHRALIHYSGDWALKFDCTPRHLWRLWDILDDGVLQEYDPRHVRRLPHRRWEVLAFKQSYEKTLKDLPEKTPPSLSTSRRAMAIRPD